MTLLGKFIFGTLFILVIGISTFYYVSQSSYQALPQAEAPRLVDVVETVKETKKIPFAEFIKDGVPYVCKVIQGSSDGTGTIYVSHGSLRGLFSGRSILVKNEGTYLWEEGATTGVMVKKHEGGATSTMASATSSIAWSVDDIGDYECADWTLESKKFSVPGGVIFSEVK